MKSSPLGGGPSPPRPLPPPNNSEKMSPALKPRPRCAAERRSAAAVVEFEMFGAAGPALSAEAPPGPPAPKPSKPRGLPSAPISQSNWLRFVRVADDFVGGIGLGEFLLAFKSFFVLVGMVFLRELAEGLDLVRARGLRKHRERHKGRA